MIVPVHLLTRQLLERFRRDKENPEMTEFGRLDPDGTYTRTRVLSQAAMAKCPHYIMVPEHYRDDETCRCDDPAHTDMREWGYTWNEREGRWL